MLFILFIYVVLMYLFRYLLMYIIDKTTGMSIKCFLLYNYHDKKDSTYIFDDHKNRAYIYALVLQTGEIPRILW